MNAALVIASGLGGGLAGPLIYNAVGRVHGYREAHQDDHRGAGAAKRARTLHITAATTGAEAGDDPSVVPDSIQPIVAWRGWALSEATLTSNHDHHAWPHRRAITAKCSSYSQRHTAPQRSCGCGIYAVKHEPDIQTHGGLHGGPYAWGRVALWGKVEEAENGYRAQYAYPISITIVNAPTHGIFITPSTLDPAVLKERADSYIEHLREKLALHYGVPVRIGTEEELAEAKASSYASQGLPPEVKELVG